MKALVIGRHANNLPIEIEETRNITFPQTANECSEVLFRLCAECESRNLALVFQAIPTQLAIALAWMGREESPKIGVVVNTPSAMPSQAIERNFGFDETYDAKVALDAVQFANPRATVEWNEDGISGFTVKVEQPRPFQFSHIEWL